MFVIQPCSRCLMGFKKNKKNFTNINVLTCIYTRGTRLQLELHPKETGQQESRARYTLSMCKQCLDKSPAIFTARMLRSHAFPEVNVSFGNRNVFKPCAFQCWNAKRFCYFSASLTFNGGNGITQLQRGRCYFTVHYSLQIF